jgi:hypothetical protein
LDENGAKLPSAHRTNRLSAVPTAQLNLTPEQPAAKNLKTKKMNLAIQAEHNHASSTFSCSAAQTPSPHFSQTFCCGSG